MKDVTDRVPPQSDSVGGSGCPGTRRSSTFCLDPNCFASSCVDCPIPPKSPAMKRYAPYHKRNWDYQPCPDLTDQCTAGCVQVTVPCLDDCFFPDDCDPETCPDIANFGNSPWPTTYIQHFAPMNTNAPFNADGPQLDPPPDCCSNNYYPQNECCIPFPVTDASGSTSAVNVDQYTAQQIGFAALFKAHNDPLPPPAPGPTFSTAPTPELSPADYLPQSIPSSSAASFACLWGGCDQFFPTLGELVGHVNLTHLRLPTSEPTHDHAHGAPACHIAPSLTLPHDSQPDALSCLWSGCSIIPAPLDAAGTDNASLCALASHLFHDHLHLPTQSTPTQPIVDIFNLNPPLSPSSASASVPTPATQALSPPRRTSPSPSSVPANSQKGKEKANPIPDGQTHTCRWGPCSETFPTCAALTDHLSTVHVGRGKASYDCHWTDCNRHGEKNGFSSKQKVLRHLQSHTGHRPFRCDVCGLDFSEAATLQQHMRRHTQEKPYVCDYPGCGKAFAITGALTIHKRTHNGDKPFKCKYCDRAFSESSNLSKHLRTHTGQRPYACSEPGCGKRFSRPDQVTRHMHVHRKKNKGGDKDKDKEGEDMDVDGDGDASDD